MQEADTPIKDINRFAEYAIRILPPAFLKDLPAHEWIIEPCLTLVDRVLMVIQCLISRSCRQSAFQLMVVLKAHYNRNSRRVRGGSSARFEESLKVMIWEYANGNASVCEYQPLVSAGPSYACRARSMDRDGMVWSADPRTMKRTYWDFASAARTLRTRYFIDEDSCGGVNHTYPYPWSCSHMTSARLLGWLQQKAWSETKYRTFCTVGTLLPAELTERIFEYALAAEAIPEDPNVEDASITRNAETPDVPSQKHRYRNISSRDEIMRLKEMYRCHHMQSALRKLDFDYPNDSDNLPADYEEESDEEDPYDYFGIVDEDDDYFL